MNKLSGRYGSADLPNSVVLTQSLANSWVRFCYYFIRRSAFPSEISNNGLRFWVKSQISPLETSKPTLLPSPRCYARCLPQLHRKAVAEEPSRPLSSGIMREIRQVAQPLFSSARLKAARSSENTRFMVTFCGVLVRSFAQALSSRWYLWNELEGIANPAPKRTASCWISGPSAPLSRARTCSRC